MDELCKLCDLSEERHFVIINENVVYVLCSEHIQDYVELYCSHCEIYHIEPMNQEYCSRAMTIFMEWNDGPMDCDDDSSSYSGIPEMD